MHLSKHFQLPASETSTRCAVAFSVEGNDLVMGVHERHSSSDMYITGVARGRMSVDRPRAGPLKHPFSTSHGDYGQSLCKSSRHRGKSASGR